MVAGISSNCDLLTPVPAAYALKPTYFDTAELMNHVVSTKVLDVNVP